jgi:uncharacterized membrane protein YhaH (DUF805 family)
MDWYLKAIKNYAVFSGRAHRTEYWSFVIINFIIMFLLEFFEGVVWDARILSGIYSLFITLPSLAVLVRRLHDTDRSGWWAFILFIPIIGFLIILIFTIQDGTPGINRYGSNPKEEKELDIYNKS